jgi:predicted dehydrogenase
MTFNVAVIGLGRWGPNHVRNFNSMKDCSVTVAVDPVEANCERIRAAYGDVACLPDFEQVLQRDDVDAVVVATPTDTHYSIVRTALEAGKHVLCEKPLTAASNEAWELVDLANAKGLQLMVGHVFLFDPGISYVGQAVRQNQAGAVYYVHAQRTNLGPFRGDVNAAWDLASHDVYIFNSILDERPVWVSCVGASYLRKPVEDIVFLTLGYPDGVIGHIHVSWLDPKKVRTLTVVGEKKMLTWDESAVPGPVMVYDCSVVRDPQYETFGDFQLLTKEGDVVVPRVQLRESLAVQARSFVDRCLYGAQGDKAGSAKQGAEVVDVLVAAEFSLKEHRQIEVTYGD